MRNCNAKKKQYMLLMVVTTIALLLCACENRVTEPEEKESSADNTENTIIETRNETVSAEVTVPPVSDVKLPSDVVDSLGQMIPVFGVSDPTLSYPFPSDSYAEEVQCEVIKDTEGRVVTLTRTYHGYVSQYAWEYDEKGQFSTFSAKIDHFILVDGHFCYDEDGSRDYILDRFSDMGWTITTCHYNADGVLLYMEGRDLGLGIRCRRLRFVPSDEIQPDHVQGRSYLEIWPNGAEGQEFVIFSFLPHMAAGAPGIDLRSNENVRKAVEAIRSSNNTEPSSQILADAEQIDDETLDELFPVKDSLGQYVDTLGWNFGKEPNHWNIEMTTGLQRNEEGNITEVVQYFPADPGAGTACMSFRYDEMGRFTEIHLSVQDSEIQDLYGFPATAHWSFNYAEDGDEICNFEIDTHWMCRHGSVTYDAEGRQLTETLTQSEDNNFLFYNYNYGVNRNMGNSGTN